MLNQLPPEVLTRICEHTDSSSLLCVVRSCRYLHKVGSGVLYRTVVIDYSNFEASIQNFTVLFDRTQSWRVPRCVTLSSSPKLDTDDDPNSTGDASLRSSIGKSSLKPPHTDTEAQNILVFLRRLPSLSHLDWQIAIPPAPAVVHLLRDELPYCQLHLKAFGIAYGMEQSYARSLLSLPNLRTLWFRHNDDTSAQELVQNILASGSNLEEVRMFWSSTGASPYASGEKIFWGQEESSETPPGRLQVLQLAGLGPGTLTGSLQRWARCTDFMYLRTLSYETILSQPILDILSTFNFRDLRSLTLVLESSFTSNADSERYNTAVSDFICSLPLLYAMRLTGGLNASNLLTIISHHGPKLHTLRLIPSGTASNRFTFSSNYSISHLQSTCKHVRDLSVTISRNWEDSTETISILQTLGTFPHLDSLDLTFDASDYIAIHNTQGAEIHNNNFSGPDAEPFRAPFGTEDGLCNGHIRNALINSAVDAELAREVFAIASSSEDSSSRLTRLCLSAQGGGDFGDGVLDMSIEEVVEEISQEWIVERCSGDLKIETRRKKSEEVVVRNEWDDGDLEEEENRLPWDLEDVFKRIWPGNGDWKREWRAFALASS